MFGDRPTGHDSRLCLAHDKFFSGLYGLRLIRFPLTTEAIHASWLWVGWCYVHVGIMEQQRGTRFLLSLELSPSPASPLHATLREQRLRERM